MQDYKTLFFESKILSNDILTTIKTKNSFKQV